MKLENDVIRIEQSNSNPLRENITWLATGDVLEVIKIDDEPGFSLDHLRLDAFVYKVMFADSFFDVPPSLYLRSIYKEHADSLTFTVLNEIMEAYSELTNNGPTRVLPANAHSNQNTPVEPVEPPIGMVVTESGTNAARMIVTREQPRGCFEVVNTDKEPDFTPEDLADNAFVFKAVVQDDDLKVTHTLYLIMLFADEPTDAFERNFLLDDFLDAYLMEKGIGPMFEYEGANPYTKFMFPVNKIVG